MKVSNLLTGLRIALMPLLFALIYQGQGYAALGVMLLAGFTDILDGYLARRLQQASRFGAFFDLLADRLLTLTLSVGLIAADVVPLGVVVALWMLVGRDFLVAGLNEAVPDRLNIRVSWIERIKIALQFLGFGALLAGMSVGEPNISVILIQAGAVSLMVSAGLCLVTVVDYILRARAVFRA